MHSCQDLIKSYTLCRLAAAAKTSHNTQYPNIPLLSGAIQRQGCISLLYASLQQGWWTRMEYPEVSGGSVTFLSEFITKAVPFSLPCPDLSCPVLPFSSLLSSILCLGQLPNLTILRTFPRQFWTSSALQYFSSLEVELIL